MYFEGTYCRPTFETREEVTCAGCVPFGGLYIRAGDVFLARTYRAGDMTSGVRSKWVEMFGGGQSEWVHIINAPRRLPDVKDLWAYLL